MSMTDAELKQFVQDFKGAAVVAQKDGYSKKEYLSLFRARFSQGEKFTAEDVDYIVLAAAVVWDQVTSSNLQKYCLLAYAR